MGIFEKFKLGFKKSASTFTSGLREIPIKKEIARLYTVLNEKDEDE